MDYLLLVHKIAIIVAITGVYFVIRIWLRWNTINLEVLKARIFLNKTFIKKNLIYVTLATMSLVPYQVVELFEHVEFISEHHILFEISEIMEVVSLIFLVVLLYEWFSILFVGNKNKFQ